MNAKRKRLDDDAGKFIFGGDQPDKKTTSAAKKQELESSDLLSKLTQESTPRERPIRVSLDLSPEMHSKRGKSSEAVTSRHATAETFTVGGTIILPFLRAYASNSCDLKELFAATASLSFNWTQAILDSKP